MATEKAGVEPTVAEATVEQFLADLAGGVAWRKETARDYARAGDAHGRDWYTAEAAGIQVAITTWELYYAHGTPPRPPAEGQAG